MDVKDIMSINGRDHCLYIINFYRAWGKLLLKHWICQIQLFVSLCCFYSTSFLYELLHDVVDLAYNQGNVVSCLHFLPT